MYGVDGIGMGGCKYMDSYATYGALTYLDLFPSIVLESRDLVGLLIRSSFSDSCRYFIL